MKNELREKLEDKINGIESRIKQLKENIAYYKENNLFEDAMKNTIKVNQLNMVVKSLKSIT